VALSGGVAQRLAEPFWKFCFLGQEKRLALGPSYAAQASLATFGHLPYVLNDEVTMTNGDHANKVREARLVARLSEAQKRLLQQAAALSGRTLSEFVVASAQDAARRVIAGHESFRLSREEQLAFVQTLLNPPSPNVRLKRAAKAYRQRTGISRWP